MTEPSQVLSETRLESSVPEWWQAPVRFLVHAVVGTFIFVVIACTALGLELFVEWLEEGGLGGPIVWGLKFGEYALFCADLLLFLIFLGRTFKRALREI